MAENGERKYRGNSTKSFADAAQNAFDKYREEILKGRPAPDPIRFRVVDMWVTASNPIHDFSIDLEQVEP